jgi:hypothetical protein
MTQKGPILAVALLAATAVGGWAWWQDRRGVTVAGHTPASPGVTNALPAEGTATNAAVAERMALAEIAREWPRWLNRPARDPFQVVRPARPREATPVTPVSRFKLMALWLQTGGRLAVIDQRVYAEGDQLAEYRILQIDPEGVLVRGPEHEDRITFASHVPAPPARSVNGTNLIERWLGPEKEDLF